MGQTTWRERKAERVAQEEAEKAAEKKASGWRGVLWKVVAVVVVAGVGAAIERFQAHGVRETAHARAEEIARAVAACGPVSELLESGGRVSQLAPEARAALLAARVQVPVTLGKPGPALFKDDAWTEADLATLARLLDAQGPGRDLHVADIRLAFRHGKAGAALQHLRLGAAELDASAAK